MTREQKIKPGVVVEWEESKCRVLKRRRVSGLGMFKTSEFEVLLETLDGQVIGWIGENELVKSTDEAGGT